MAKDTMTLLENMFRKRVMELGKEKMELGKERKRLAGSQRVQLRLSWGWNLGQPDPDHGPHLYYMVPLAWETISCSLQR